MVFVAKLVRQLMGLLLSVNKVVGGRGRCGACLTI